jgi:hypothetical protein
MVQCGILVLLVVITTTVTIAWYKNISRAHQLFSHTLPLYIATYVMRADVHNARIISFEDGRLRLTYQHQAYAWYVIHNKLMRSLMTYDARDHRWLKPTVAVIALCVMSSRWEPIVTQGALTGLSVSLQNMHSSIEAVFATRNELII